MSAPTTLQIFEAFRDALRAVKLDDTADSVPLFDSVELYPNKQLVQALRDLVLVKDRICLVVPLAVRRIINDQSGVVSVNGRKYAEVALLYTDRALFQSAQKVTFGSDKNPGLFAIDDRIEAAIIGKEISPFGGIILGDSDPILLTDKEQSSAPERHGWLVQALVPTGFIIAAA
jgi:hypothetical protein